jgi:hypothetical protein
MLLLVAGIQKERTKEWLVQTSFHGSASDDFRVAGGEWYWQRGDT